MKILRGLFGGSGTKTEPAAPAASVLSDPRLESRRRCCWKPVTEPGEDGARSKFSGTPILGSAEAWPACANCGKPMQLFLQLRSVDLPAEFPAPWGDGVLQFFYCDSSEPQCDVDCEAWDPFAKSTLLRVIEDGKSAVAGRGPARPFPARQITGWRRLDDLPGWEELRGSGLSDAEAEEVGNAEYPRSGDKLGGWPMWVQGIEYPSCPTCGAEMKFLFQIDSEDNLPFMFGDAGCGHLTYCAEHPRVLAFRWACH